MRVGVVGLGEIGREHLRIYRSMPDVVVAAVADFNPEVAKDVGENVGVAAFASAEEMVACIEVDAVSLCTPDDKHFADAKLLIESGKHLLIEKPIATTIEEADALVALAENSKVCVMPGHTLRFDQAYIAARSIVEAGSIGDIVHGSLRRDNTKSVATRVGGRASVTLFLGIHDIEALTWITGLRVTHVQAMESAQRTPDGGQAVAVLADLRLQNGSVVQLEAAWGLPDEHPSGIDARLRLVGSLGEVSIDIRDFGMSFFGETVGYPRPINHPVHGLPQNPLSAEISTFVRLVLDGGISPITMRQAADAVHVATAIDRAAASGQTITLRYGK